MSWKTWVDNDLELRLAAFKPKVSALKVGGDPVGFGSQTHSFEVYRMASTPKERKYRVVMDGDFLADAVTPDVAVAFIQSECPEGKVWSDIVVRDRMSNVEYP